jgi:peptidoglycan/LPS O-acetylase OafA/YrhL
MLRSVAVFYVLADHSLKLLGRPAVLGVDVQWVGKLGVMFFFVHTCMVLMMSLERTRKGLSNARLVGNFYLRRICRIYPLSIFSICSVLLFSIPSALIQGPFNIVRVTPSIKVLSLNILLLQNFSILHASSVIAVLWSLPFEVQMYVFLPFLFLFLLREGRSSWLFAIWAFGMALLFLLRPHIVFLAHFMPGVIAYEILKRISRQRVPSWLWPIFVAFLTLAFLAVRPSFITGGIACLVLGIVLPNVQDLKWQPVNVLTHTIAKYSYGVYLCHMFCLWLAFIHLHALPIPVQGLIFIGALLTLPILLYKLIEEPWIRVGASLADQFVVSQSRVRSKTAPDKQAEQLEETASGA